MDIRLSLARTAPKQPPRKQKPPSRASPKKQATDEIRFWKGVALTLALSLMSLIFTALIAVLLK